MAAKGNYWAAVALYKLDRKTEATERWQRLVDSQPLGYYGMLARVRLRDQGVKVSVFADPARRSADDCRAGPSPVSRRTPEVVGDPQFERAAELLTVGLAVEASTELRRIESGLTQRYGSGRTLPVLLDLYTRAQSFQRPHQLAEVYGASALRRDPQRCRRRARCGRPPTRWPTAASSKSTGPPGRNPPRYLYSIHAEGVGV